MLRWLLLLAGMQAAIISIPAAMLTFAMHRHAHIQLYQCIPGMFDLQQDDPPEGVGAYQYSTHSNPTGQDTITRMCSSTGQQQILLSAAAMQADARAATKMLGCTVQGKSRKS